MHNIRLYNLTIKHKNFNSNLFRLSSGLLPEVHKAHIFIIVFIRHE